MATLSLSVALPRRAHLTARAHFQTGHRGVPSSAAKKPSPVIRRMSANQTEVIKSLEGWASKHMLPFLKPVEGCWQPQDFLPISSQPSDEFFDEVQALREKSAELSDEYFVVLVGDMITEDAVPTYHSQLTNTHGFEPASSSDPSGWATWIRRWTAEENRHGDLLRSYLYLSGRVDMVMVERTIQYLIGAGMDVGVGWNPYLALVYTTFQERATAITHGNTARLAKQSGNTVVANICGTIAADEKRHEKAYTAAVGKLLEVDPTGAMLAIGEMMKKNIVMPSHLMYDGRNPELFEHYSTVAQRIGVYTASDYVEILQHLIDVWMLEKVVDLTDEGREAQEFVCGLPQRLKRLQERAEEQAKKKKPCGVEFSWIFNKKV